MNIKSLIGKTLQSALTSMPCEIDPAWEDVDAYDISSFAVFLICANQIYEITPCEVEVSKDSYPDLGLSIIKRIDNSTKIQLNGSNKEAEPIPETLSFLLQKIIDIQENDLRTGDTAMYTIILANSVIIKISHILPPETIGVTISNVKQDT